MINRVVLVGRLVRDPELRKTATGLSVASFTIAIDNRTKGPNGEKTTSFIPCTAWGQTAEFASRFSRKGSLVGVEGRLNQRSYDSRDNRRVSVVEVICDAFQSLEKKPDDAQQNQFNSNEQNYGFEQSKPVAVEPEVNNVAGIDIAEDDLPF